MLRNRISPLKRQILRLQNMNKEFESQTQQLHSTINELQNTVSELQNQISQLQEEVNQTNRNYLRIRKTLTGKRQVTSESTENEECRIVCLLFNDASTLMGH